MKSTGTKMGFGKFELEKWFVQNEGVLIRCRAGISSSRAHGGFPWRLAGRPWLADGKRSQLQPVLPRAERLPATAPISFEVGS